MSLDPGQRIYLVSDERLRAFRALTPAQRLRWVEELAQFLRLARDARKRTAPTPSTDR
ncbi:hypothetical protein RHDC4_00292 [Rhodocyclaceae bacterium]|nr:hypothetical protein RHDC4_00292 [Rhodocyclaceae bacterium]